MNEKRMLYIRADANETIGTGHVMRCLSIAKALQDAGGDACFIAADSRTEAIVLEHGFSTICLQSVWNDLSGELDSMIRLIQEKKISLLLVDSYYATPRYLGTLRQHTRLAYVDDLEAFPCSADLLIRYALYCEETAGQEGRESQAGQERQRILAGCEFAPLRKEFCDLPKRRIRKRPRRILVLTGGTDPCHVALEVARQAVKEACFGGLTFNIVCGRYNPDLTRLCSLAEMEERLLIHSNVSDLKRLMLEADIAITAGGTSVYELCACGTPSVCYILADNQIRNAEAFTGRGLMLSGGDVRCALWQGVLLEQLKRLMADWELRAKMAERMQELIDGKGAMRIAKALLTIGSEGVT